MTVVAAPAVRVPIEALQPGDSPRRDGEDTAHARALADSAASLPPILVHRPTMRVIDGMHRVHAARLAGLREIEAQFFDGSAEDAFVLAVKTNVAHGLPLSLTDRKAAATRIARSHPQWSDRAIARVAGLSPKTVGAVRRCSAEEVLQSHSRIGRDGRVRPVDATTGRRVASEIIARHPGMSLREIGRTAGISPGTARDVRERMRRGEDPLPPRQRTAQDSAGPADHTVLGALVRDPVLRSTEDGRVLLRWLTGRLADPAGWVDRVGTVPEHCRELIARVAWQHARTWREFAERLDQLGRTGEVRDVR
ncbi:ParB N-terminal domain-containing protein [Kibdelosporangium phytohabitans]|nr:ParB N-terminal domain-containing protein [Kibdelosporangium phytohabitans]MBE1464095.1 DNA-binding CsgD family transcriptional regulator [Kibdelosporangium phytohabitans]